MRAIWALGLVAMLAGPALAEAPAGAPEGNALIFADRDFSGAAKGIAWRLDRAAKAQAEGFTPVTDGRLTLNQITDPKDGAIMLELHEVDPARDRIVGRYPQAGMDPVLVYFLETTTRNMSALAGGSADYIRNRIKAALREGGTVADGEGGAKVVTLEPFKGDPAAERMQGFQSMRLTLTLAPEAGAPIRALLAEAPDAGYRLSLAPVSP